MNAKNKLFHIILVLFYDAHREKPGQYNTYIKELLSGISTANDSKIPVDEIKDIRALKNLAAWLLKQTEGKVSRDAAIAKLKFFVKDETIVSAFESVLVEITDREQLDFTINDNIRDLKELLHYETVHEMTKNVFYEIARGGLNGYREVLTDYADKIKLLAEKGSSEGDKEYSYIVDGSKEGVVAELLQQAAELGNAKGRRTTGSLGLDRLIGGDDTPGAGRGDFIMYGANTHNNKSGMAYFIFQNLIMLNQPYMIDSSKKPLIVFVSTEDNASKAMAWWFKHLYEQTHRVSVRECTWSWSERDKFLRENFTRTGYDYRYLRVKDSTDYTIFKLLDTLDKFEREGYEIHDLFIDYLFTFNKKGLGNGVAGTDIKELVRRVRNYCNPRLITVWAPHQLNSESMSKLRDFDKEEDFVKSMPYKGYLEGGKGIAAELDVEWYQHIVEVKDVNTGLMRYFLSVQRGKRRADNASRNELRYMLMEFSPIGGILPDHCIEGEPVILTSLDEITISDGGEW